ncbi:MAG: O-antigen ligase family protein [Chloroflexi bacterium]|nr:O-antigen ligase family protein [Chloroflexota bacterium]
MLTNSLRRLPPDYLKLRLLAVVGLPLLALAIGYTFSLSQAVLILGALGALVAALLLLRWPSLGIATLVVSTVIVPFSVSTGTKTNLNLPVFLIPGLIALGLFDMTARKGHFRFILARADLAALGLSLAAALAFTLGQLPWFPLAPAPITAQLGGLAVFLLSAGAFLLASHQLRDKQWLRRITWLFLLLGSLHLFAFLAPNRLPLRGLFNPIISSVFLTWIVALAFSQALFNHRLHPFWRVALALVVLLTFFLTFFRLRAWASGWLPGVVTVLVIIYLWRPRLGLVLGMVCGSFALFYMNEILDVVVLQDNFYSLETRLAAWQILLEIINVNPLLGLGPANYYWYTPLYNILGYYVQFNSHNQYLDIIAQAGLVGLGCFAWWAYELARIGWRLRDRAPAGFERAYVYAALGGLAGTLFAGMLGDWILPFVYNVGLAGFKGSVVGWLFLGGLVGLDKIYRKEQEPAPAEV